MDQTLALLQSLIEKKVLEGPEWSLKMALISYIEIHIRAATEQMRGEQDDSTPVQGEKS